MARGLFLFILVLMPAAVHAACDVGYYVSDGECVRCTSGYYCPDGISMIECPVDTTDWYSELASDAYKINKILYNTYYSWAPGGGPAYEITHCVSAFRGYTTVGEFYVETGFDTTEYRKTVKLLWYYAKPGYYLSGWRFTTWRKFYYGVKPCTNYMPEHAHYSNAGTPDEPKLGGVTDYNDCPWACNSGYGLHDDACVPLCASGMQHIKTGTGLSFNLYPVAYSTPALVVQKGDVKCFGGLGQGASPDAININHGGKIYHIKN